MTVTPPQRATQSPEGPYEALYVLDTPTVVGIAFAAFVIGALLTGALWFIYSHTGRCLYRLLRPLPPRLALYALMRKIRRKEECPSVPLPATCLLGMPNILLLTEAASQ
ncbi:Transforming growth factor beta receptor type 3 [Liparis tanakae]|uniref:Transforming growth factor beta receptor type 3 n=1 Tax=Liparis tanakae TaxID=230148 RepID=A0A4Z2I442_9TELE|nr:Transforming growth factor beta receptor type 3 [Liparis tanakae]